MIAERPTPGIRNRNFVVAREKQGLGYQAKSDPVVRTVRSSLSFYLYISTYKSYGSSNFLTTLSISVLVCASVLSLQSKSDG